jgi:hypothetical protein
MGLRIIRHPPHGLGLSSVQVIRPNQVARLTTYGSGVVGLQPIGASGFLLLNGGLVIHIDCPVSTWARGVW